jgi:hypothetical protein
VARYAVAFRNTFEGKVKKKTKNSIGENAGFFCNDTLNTLDTSLDEEVFLLLYKTPQRRGR